VGYASTRISGAAGTGRLRAPAAEPGVFGVFHGEFVKHGHPSVSRSEEEDHQCPD
jgi:hypothetical protein